MRTAIMYAALALTITTAGAAEEDMDSANSMLRACKLTVEQARGDWFNAFRLGQCAGAVSTIRDMFGLLKDAEAAGAVKLNPRLCADIPERATLQQLVNVVLKFGEAHPESTHQPFNLFAMAAIGSAWPRPCKK